jgi:hypothetical protein
MTRILVLVLLILLAVELGPPVWRGTPYETVCKAYPIWGQLCWEVER